ncbi:hypothetical protein MAIT1_00827 [Magnetofaba australis IT-1]|uniref:Uncharacterized protein n=1 Tax=Magnetofaba australis IT-1 TaxID=1434232 RepID=A0A1Y2K2A9_9PROT|nr:hypothetical protein MAIT1_00827 [Magnetofaba australis IT-1]
MAVEPGGEFQRRSRLQHCGQGMFQPDIGQRVRRPLPRPGNARGFVGVGIGEELRIGSDPVRGAHQTHKTVAK